MEKTQRDRIISVVAVVIVIVLLLVTGLVENQVSIEGDMVHISGMYGQTYEKAEVISITLADSLPAIERRINGASFFAIRKGIYRMSGIERARLFIHANEGPYLRIETESVTVFINYRDPHDTLDAYERIAPLLD